MHVKEGRWIEGWKTSVMDFAGTEYEEYLFFSQEELLQILKENISKIDNDWEWYTKSGERFGTNVERSHPDLSYVYGRSLDKHLALSWILRYKMINQQRFIHQALSPEKQSQIRRQLTDILQGGSIFSYTEILGFFPEAEAELVLDDLIESGQLDQYLKKRRK